MCIRDSLGGIPVDAGVGDRAAVLELAEVSGVRLVARFDICLLYTSDAADERSSVDLGGRRIIKKKKYNLSIDAHQSTPDNTVEHSML